MSSKEMLTHKGTPIHVGGSGPKTVKTRTTQLKTKRNVMLQSKLSVIRKWGVRQGRTNEKAAMVATSSIRIVVYTQ